jgi:hypothetical protein
MRGAAIAVLALATLAPAAWAQQPTTDVIIRSQAGLPASSAIGEIQLIDVGHNALSPMLSIVGHRTAGGWRISYACASSPACDQKRFMLAKEFDLPADRAAQVDAVLDGLRAQPDLADPPVPPNMICGHLSVAIKDRGFQHEYRRSCTVEKSFTELEGLLRLGLP